MASALAGRAPAGGNEGEIIRALEHATLLHLGLVAHSVKHTNFLLGVNILNRSHPHQPPSTPTIKRRAPCAFSSLAGPATPARTSSPS